MASLNLSPDEIKVLESVRQRLAQVVSSLQKFKDDVVHSQPLPPASSIQASTTIIQQNLRTLTSFVAENATLLERIALHPSTNFPGRQHEAILLQLLRKKPEPSVETLLDEGRETARKLGGDGNAGAWKAQRALWKWAREYCDERIGQYAREETLQVYTAEERAMGIENVRTGLRKSMDEEEDEDEDEDEEGDEGNGVKDGGKTGVAGGDELAKMARFKLARNSVVGRFEMPPNADWEAKRKMVGVGVGVGKFPGR
ncbi:hypothetical protein jhhlp_004505 [Lomentospora prolificans]|uniref:Mediator of RNA polymerase II transcription subunit 8 n=1 Tax=Lomentospora prolificans TaxID=41688 RepID=A0A2N3NBZ4_9PEZI|nr:hypothetical protein jhhlp_004505 [Lomentospora prolificans]